MITENNHVDVAGIEKVIVTVQPYWKFRFTGAKTVQKTKRQNSCQQHAWFWDMPNLGTMLMLARYCYRCDEASVIESL
jgi:hypothetical protein